MQGKEPENSTNLMLAVALSMAVLFAWQVFYAGPKLKEEQARLDKEKAAQSQTVQPPAPGGAPVGPSTAPGPSVPGGAGTTTAQAPVAGGDVPKPSAVPAGPLSPEKAAELRAEALKGAPRVAIETPSLKGSIALKGGRIDDLLLAKYRLKADPKSANVPLFSPAEAPYPYFAEIGWSAQSGGLKLPDRDTVWTLDKSGPLTPKSPLVMLYDNGQGLVFRRTITIDDDYMFKIMDEIENKTQADITVFPYARLYRYGTPQIEGFYIQHEGLIGVLGDAGLKELTYSDVMKEGGSQRFEGKIGGWLGITDKYWAAALIPDQTATYSGALRLASPRTPTSKEAFQADYLRAGLVIPPASRKGVESRIFAGAKQVDLIERYEDASGIKQFDLLIDWGWFYFITKPLYHLINWFYKLLGNFGLAILAVTVLVKLAFFPLANKSYESMAKMKKLQPEMEQLRERFKDDKAAQQQELMKLYQKEKINPLAGCLPILVQIPVFFALYKVLFVSIDMRHAPFFGWIKDLSAPDPTSLFNLFGLLPFAVPEYFAIGAWPVIMGITMWLQMQLNPPQPDPMQQAIFNWMPVLFTFLLASFPAGLVIYWAWNNILSMSQQAFILKKQGVKIPLKENIVRIFGPLLSLVGIAKADKGAKS
ncbi:MAG: membrane protein insertase YidC [Hyphomicrobiaceae bacterium]|nr:membrane protein insertase YidC [Hyphomicrobiaceae bacterium]